MGDELSVTSGSSASKCMSRPPRVLLSFLQLTVDLAGMNILTWFSPTLSPPGPASMWTWGPHHGPPPPPCPPPAPPWRSAGGRAPCSSGRRGSACSSSRGTRPGGSVFQTSFSDVRTPECYQAHLKAVSPSAQQRPSYVG